MTDIVRKKGAVLPWYTARADESGRVFADTLMIRLAEQAPAAEVRRTWASFKKRWMTCLLRGRHLVRRTHPPLDERHPDQWYFALTDKFDSACPLFPAEKYQVPGSEDVCFLPSSLSQEKPIVYAAVLGLAVWESWTYKWRCPLWVWRTYPAARVFPSWCPDGVRAWPSTPAPNNIMVTAARCGFWQIGVQALRKFKAELGHPDFGTTPASLYNVLVSLIGGILNLSEAEVMPIIVARLGGQRALTCCANELRLVDEGLELLDQEEKDATILVCHIVKAPWPRGRINVFACVFRAALKQKWRGSAASCLSSCLRIVCTLQIGCYVPSLARCSLGGKRGWTVSAKRPGSQRSVSRKGCTSSFGDRGSNFRKRNCKKSTGFNACFRTKGCCLLDVTSRDW